VKFITTSLEIKIFFRIFKKEKTSKTFPAIKRSHSQHFTPLEKFKKLKLLKIMTFELAQKIFVTNFIKFLPFGSELNFLGYLIPLKICFGY